MQQENLSITMKQKKTTTKKMTSYSNSSADGAYPTEYPHEQENEMGGGNIT